MNKSRVAAVLTGLVAAPMLLGATIGAGTASAQPFHIGPLYRIEYANDGGNFVCIKDQADDQASGAIPLVGCRFDGNENVWYRVAFNLNKLGFSV